MLRRANSRSVTGLAGVLFVVISLADSFVNVQPPTYDAEQAEVVAWFGEDAEGYRIGHLVAGLAFLLFYFPFFAGFYARLREAEGAPAVWSRTALAGAIISPAAGTIAGTFIISASLLEESVDPGVATFALTGFFYALLISGAYAGVVMLGASIVIIGTAVFPRWLGWAGLAAGIAAIGGTLALVENDPDGIFATISGLAWLAYFLWILALSIALIRESGMTGVFRFRPRRSHGKAQGES